jgi:hypothetical protein
MKGDRKVKKHILIIGLAVLVLGVATTVLAQGPDGPGGPIFEAIEDLQSRVAALEAALTIAELSCAEGQVAKYSGGTWACADDDDTTYAAGNQLHLDGDQFNVLEGSGSDLDADTFDGIESERFLYTDDGVVSRDRLRFVGHVHIGGEPGVESSLNVWDDLTTHGDVTVGSINYHSSHTHYLSIPQTAFQPTEDRLYQLGSVEIGAFSERSAALVTPVYLPDGAIVREIACYFYDAYVDGDLSCDLKYVALASGEWGHMAGTDSETSDGHIERRCCSGLMGVIENNEKAYFVIVEPDPRIPGWPEVFPGEGMGIKGVVLRYEIDQVP